MTWIEPGYVSKKEGFCTWRVREWDIDKNGKRIKKTLDVIKMPIVFPRFETYNSIFAYHIFLCFDIDGFDNNYGVYVQIDMNDKSKWLPDYPKHLELFVGDDNE